MDLAGRPLWTPMTLGLTPTPGSSLRRKKKGTTLDYYQHTDEPHKLMLHADSTVGQKMP